jgi:hypothetical protein
VEETPARVAWREGDGFVGWAPEDPDDVMVLDEVEYEDWYDWTFTLIGTLLEDSLDQHTLSGEARDQARRATAPGRAADGSFPRRKVGPSGSSVATARGALTDYVAKHPDVIAAAAAQHHTTAVSASPSSGKGSSSGSKAKDAKDAKDTKEKEGLSVTVAVTPLPPAMVYYDAFVVAPPAPAPGLLPQAPRATAAVLPSAHGSSDTAYPGGHAVDRTAHGGVSHGAASTIRMPSPAQHAPAAASSSSSSSYRSSYHSSGSGSGGSSSHSSSHTSSKSHSAHR